MLMMCVGMGAWAEEYSFTIQTSDFNTTSYAANNGSHDFTATCKTDASKTMTVACTSNQVYQNSSNMQWQKSNGYIYNTTDLGTIKSVTVNSSAGTFTTYYGTTEHPTSGTTVGDGFFTVVVGGATGYTSSIVVVFEKASGGSTETPTNYTITVANNIANGTVTASSTSAAKDAEITLTATPAEGYEFDSWNVTDASTKDAIEVKDNKFTMPAANVNVSATFNQIQGGDEPSGNGTTGTIKFGTNDVNISSASVTGDDDLGNRWTITTDGTTSFTQNQTYSQVGSSKSPAISIEFTTTLPASTKITSMSAKFGGFSGTAGTVTLKVGGTTVGTGSLNETNDVTINSIQEETGTVLTVTVTGIAKGVKCYNIAYTYDDGVTDAVSIDYITVKNAPSKTSYIEGETFVPAGLVITKNMSDGTTEDVAYDGDTNRGFTFSPSLLTLLSTTHDHVTITYGGKSVDQNIVVEAFKPTAGTYDVVPNNALWGTNYNGTANVKANEFTQEGVVGGVKLVLNNGSSTNRYINNDQTRVYNGYTLQFDAPEGFFITAIAFTADGTDWTGNHTATEGEMTDNKNWKGVSESVTVSFKGTCRITNISVTYAEALPASISSAGYATFVPSKSVEVPLGVTAYAVKIDGDKAKLTPVQTIPANKAVVLKGGEGTYYFPKIELADGIDTDLNPSATDVTADGSQYILAKDNGIIGFYKATPGTTIAAGKAYLEISDTSVKAITFEEVTAIDAVATTDAKAAIYNLRGQRVSADYKGIVIKNGKKYLNK